MKVLFTFSLIFVSLAAHAQDLDKILDKFNDHSIPYIATEELHELQFRNSIWILDAREWEEYEVSHIPNALYAGFNDFSEERVLKSLPNRDTPIVVYCSIGVRSEKIGKRLKKLGFVNVRNLYGGIFEWVNNGLSIENNAGEETENIHAFSRQWGQFIHKGQKVY